MADGSVLHVLIGNPGSRFLLTAPPVNENLG